MSITKFQLAVLAFFWFVQGVSFVAFVLLPFLDWRHRRAAQHSGVEKNGTK